MPVAEAAYQEFQVNEGLVALPQSASFSADEITGEISAELRRSGEKTFSLKGRTTFARFLRKGKAVLSRLNESYAMYIEFTVEWQVDDSDRWLPTSATLNWYIAPGLWPAADSSRASVPDDHSDVLLIATCNLLQSGAASDRLFELRLGDFNLTTIGSQYFVSPIPFYITIRFSGDYACLPGEKVVEVLGRLNTVFAPWNSNPDVAAQVGS